MGVRTAAKGGGDGVRSKDQLANLSHPLYYSCVRDPKLLSDFAEGVASFNVRHVRPTPREPGFPAHSDKFPEAPRRL